MSLQRGVLPTLTEVIEIDAADLPRRIAVAPLPPESIALEDLHDVLVLRESAASASSMALAAAALASPVEERVQDLLAPHLTRLVDDTLQNLRTELALQVQVLVRQAIEEVLAEHRGG